MAKKAELKNLTSLQGVSIFRNGLLPTQQTEAEAIEVPVAPALATVQPISAATSVQSAPPSVPANQSPIRNAQPTDDNPQHPVQETSKQEEKKMLRSYHLSESLIQRLEDAHMVYQLRKEKTNKQDIVVEALTRYLDELEQQGFFNVLKALRA